MRGHPVYLCGRNGLGDAIYTRAVARAVARKHPTYVATAWPELFMDLPVGFCKPTSNLAGPNANVARYPDLDWRERPAHAISRRIRYAWQKLSGQGILAQMETRAKTTLVPFVFDLPALPRLIGLTSIPLLSERVAVVRPVTIRADWPNPARNPDPIYLVRAAELLMEAGFYVVSVADLSHGEVRLGLLPPAHQRFDHGELGVLEVLSLVHDAAVVVGGPGWIVPACLASGAPLVVIGGGQGGCNDPQALVDPRMDARRARWVLPAPYCRCTSKHHDCPKTIPDFENRFAAALDSHQAVAA